jgi:hypothetical protein
MQNPNYVSSQSKSKEVDAGLKRYLSNIYTKMTAGVLVTAIVSMIVGSSPMLLNLFLGGPQKYLVIFAPLAIIWFGFRPESMSPKQLMAAFFGLAVVYGISFASIAAVALGNPIFAVAVAKSFFITTAMFAGLSIYGYTTKRDLGPMQSFIVMGIWGLVGASVLNIFFQNDMMSNVIAGVGIVLFAGLTAWQTQAMKEMYSPNASKDVLERIGWAAALNLYISFVAMFQYILHFMSQR